jgi:hypothetical protein
MKLERHGSKAQISGAVGGPQSFSIVGSSIAFKILSSGLYSNKILACIRELSCNAWDAHVMNGNTNVPFEIHLPTGFEPWFSVKDFGCGLNPEAEFVYDENGTRIGKYRPGAKLEKGHVIRKIDELIDLYCTYFSSNKSDSNDVIGAMGLGSKSPFCYTEGFTVTSRFNGKTRIASAYITEAGTPDIVVQSEEDTPGVPNGLEVMFPAKSDDCWEFENNASVALEFFQDPAPVMTGEPLKVEPQVYVMKTSRWGMRAKAETHQGSGMRAIQGKVAYSVGKIDISKMGPELQALMAMPLDLFFPIGELAVAASRESLQLDPRTVKNIIQAMEDVYNGLIEEVKKEIDKCAQPWEARLLIFKLINAPGTGKIINEALNKGALDGVYKNFSLAGKKPSVNELDYLYTQVYKFEHNGRSTKWANKSFVFSRSTDEHRAIAHQELANGTKKRKDFEKEFDVDNGVLFVINDLKFGGEKYIHYFLQEADDNVEVKAADGTITNPKKDLVFLFSRKDPKQTPAQVMKEAAAMVEKLGNPPMVMMSDLKAKYSAKCDVIAPKKPSVPREKRDILELNLIAPGSKLRYGRTGAIPWYGSWKRSESQPSGVKYYVVVEDYKATQCGFNKCGDLIDFVKHVANSGEFGFDGTLYGLKPKSPLRLHKDWVEFTSYVLNSIKNVMTRSKEMEMSILLKPFRPSEWEEVVEAVAKDKTFPKDSPFKLFADTLASAKNRAKSNALIALKAVLDEAKKRNHPATLKPYYSDQFTVNFKNGWEELLKQYPIMQVTRSNYYYDRSPVARVMMDYIKSVDAAVALKALKESSATSAVVAVV